MDEWAPVLEMVNKLHHNNNHHDNHHNHDNNNEDETLVLLADGDVVDTPLVKCRKDDVIVEGVEEGMETRSVGEEDLHVETTSYVKLRDNDGEEEVEGNCFDTMYSNFSAYSSTEVIIFSSQY